MKEKNVFIFVPNNLKYNKNGYLLGDCKEINGHFSYYITSEEVIPLTSKPYNVIGIISNNSQKSGKNHMKQLAIENLIPNGGGICIDGQTKRIVINNFGGGDNASNGSPSIIQVNYDFITFQNTDIVNNNYNMYGEHFRVLNKYLKETKCTTKPPIQCTSNLFITLLIMYFNSLLKLLNIFKPILLHSSTFLYLENSVLQYKWILNSLTTGGKRSKLGNAICARILDVLIGIYLLNFLLNNQQMIFRGVINLIEDIIQNLEQLLIYLMGAPIGLKLNLAFNTYLGTFFLYHIRLWRVFLKGVQPIFVEYFVYFVLPGLFGLTCQIAMLSDLIAVATFHVYCIYVYAARLFNIQINGIISLWRLFIGRKYNPLRNRVDSCDYSQNQLFIGTLGFTVLLFLLPTTMMYYSVFVTLRLIIYIIDKILKKLRFYIIRLPIYVTLLWLFKSPSVAGNLCLNWQHTSDARYVKLEAKLYTLPLLKIIDNFVPFDIQEGDSQQHLSQIFQSAVTGIAL